MDGINRYFEIDWKATGEKLNTLLRNRVELEALAEWAVRDVRTIRNWLNDPSMMQLDELVVVAKFLDMDLLSIIVTKGSQKSIGVLEEYFGGVERTLPQRDAVVIRRGRPRKYNPECTEAQQFIDKALYNEYLQRREEYMYARPMEEFLLYYPLFNQSDLADFVYRTMGDTCNNRAYVYEKMDWLIKSIPNNAAKRFADKMRYFCLTKPNVYEIADCVINDAQTEKKLEEFFEYEGSKEYKIESEAYFDACNKSVNRLSFLDKLKRQMDDILLEE